MACLAGASMLLPGGAQAQRRTQRHERFVVYYSDRAPISAFAPFQTAVLDADYHPPLAPLRARGIRCFGYISAGEAERARSHAPDLPPEVVLAENPNWPGSHYADVRHPAWNALVLDRLVPQLLARGFDGIFLDTLDNPPFLEARDPVANRGMTAAAAALVLAIRARNPGVPIMLNRAYELHETVGGAIDIVLAESLLGGYDFAARRYRPVDADGVRWGLTRLDALRSRHPSVRIFALDYWDPEDLDGIRRLYRANRERGFIPYVATIDLHRIVTEP